MTKKIRRRLEPILTELSTDRRKSVRQELQRIWRGWDGSPTSTNDLLDQAIKAIEEDARGMIAEAVHRVSDFSTAPKALTVIRESLRSYVTESGSDLAHAGRQAGGLPFLGMPAFKDRLDDALKRLELHLNENRGAIRTAKPAEEETPAGKRGPKPKYDWWKATHAVWGQIHRRTLIPKAQKDIEHAFVALLARVNPNIETTTVRPYARPIWREMGFEPED